MQKTFILLAFLATIISCDAQETDTVRISCNTQASDSIKDTINVQEDSIKNVQEESISTGFDWEPLMKCIIQVESRGNARARNGRFVGAMQISPGLVRECNNILARRGYKKRFTLNDRYSIEKSKEMFIVFQSRYNPKNSIEYAIRSWCGGARFKKKTTQRYYNKIMRLYSAKKK